MNIKEFLFRYRNVDGIVVKRKNEILDFTVTAGVFIPYKLRIYVDSEKLCIGKKVIKMCNLKKMYIFANRDAASCSIEIIGKNELNSKSIIISSFSEEDLDKMAQLIEHFLFDCEVDSIELHKDDYEFLIDDIVIDHNISLNKYDENQKGLSLLTLNGVNYSHKLVLPKKYYKKYLSEGYLLFETKFENPNYMDVWISEEKERKNSLIFVILVMSLFIFLIIDFFMEWIYPMIEDVIDTIN